MKVIEAIKKGKVLLDKENLETPMLDCRILMGKILNLDLNNLIFNYQFELTKKEENLFKDYIKRRLNHEPVAKIINKKSFWNFDFYTDENVLDPRPDTETLIELVLEDYEINDKLSILDLGCGSGCIILTLLKLFKNSSGFAVDINEKSLAIAKKNAEVLKVNNIVFKKSNWTDEIEEKFDIIVSNPPYIPTLEINNLSRDVKDFDPRIALDGGNDGLECYRYIAKNIKKNCKKKAKIYLEIGVGQGQNVKRIFCANDFKYIKKKSDLLGVERVLNFEYL